MESQTDSRQKVFKRQDFPVLVTYWKGSHIDDLSILRHSEMELQFIGQGGGEYFIGSSHYKFHKNSVLIIHGNEPHTFVKEGGLVTEKITLIFSPKVLSGRDSALEAVSDLKNINHLVLPDRLSTRSRLILEQMMEECRSKESHWGNIVVDLLETLLVILSRSSVSAKAAPDEADPFIKDVIDYLEQHFAEKLSLIGVAEHFSMSPYGLSKMFKHRTGIGFKQYLIRCRITEAKRLLEQTGWKIARTALEVGFVEISTFNREFRSITGIKPSDYRKLCT